MMSLLGVKEDFQTFGNFIKMGNNFFQMSLKAKMYYISTIPSSVDFSCESHLLINIKYVADTQLKPHPN